MGTGNSSKTAVHAALGGNLLVAVTKLVAAGWTGLLLAATAFIIGQETKALLIGERASAEVRASIVDAATHVEGIVSVQELITVHLSPTQIVVALEVEFEDHLTTPVIERCVQRLEAGVTARHAGVVALFVKPRAPAG